MGSIDVTLSHRLKAAHRLSPKTMLGTNLLFVPLCELTDSCREILGDNPFFSFMPPRWQCMHEDIDDLDFDLASDAEGMEERLLLQIATCPGLPSGGRAASASFWASLLNEDGFLNTSPREIAQMLGAEEGTVLGYIRALQDYVDPPGLFASSLTECLLIQLKRIGLEGSLAWRLLEEGREYIISGRTAEFALKNGWDGSGAEDAMRTLRKLDPAPGKNFARQVNVVPEIEFVTGFEVPKIRLIRENLPYIESSLCELPVNAAQVIAERWMRPIWSRAKLVLTRLGMRYRTLVRISMRIADVQRGYLNGAQCLPSPLTYAQVAHELNLSVSTVYRCVKETWCLVFGRSVPMKDFFSRSLGSRPDMTVRGLCAAIADLNSRGLCDREIAETLSVPRRTVAHHRNKLGLPSVFDK